MLAPAPVASPALHQGRSGLTDAAACRSVSELIGKLAAERPGRPLAKIEEMLIELVC